MEYAEEFKKLANILNKSKKVNSLDKDDHIECEVLAHSLLDIRDSCKEIVNRLLPRLFSSEISEGEIEDVLLGVGEELRHIIYHIRATNYYDYLKEE